MYIERREFVVLEPGEYLVKDDDLVVGDDDALRSRLAACGPTNTPSSRVTP